MGVASEVVEIMIGSADGEMSAVRFGSGGRIFQGIPLTKGNLSIIMEARITGGCHGGQHRTKAGSEGAAAKAGGGAEAPCRGTGSKPARPRAAGCALPLQACFLTEALFDGGIGTLVLTRGVTSDRVALSSYLLDTFCLGIKDVTFELVGGEYFQSYMDTMDSMSPMVSVDPSYARKLLRDLAVWSRSIVSPRTGTSQLWSGYLAT
jgi:hypothetical protein